MAIHVASVVGRCICESVCVCVYLYVAVVATFPHAMPGCLRSRTLELGELARWHTLIDALEAGDDAVRCWVELGLVEVSRRALQLLCNYVRVDPVI